jgi:cytosine/adenosine deaminase-related metal-dependent hydrolase
MTAREALELATRGGAAVLGRDDLGSLEAGKCADLIAIDLNRLEYAGALHDPVSAIVFCAPVKVDYTIEEEMIKRVKRLRQGRNNQTVKTRLERIRQAARGTENIIPTMLEAVKAYATIGEISDTLRAVFGEYKEQAVYL